MNANLYGNLLGYKVEVMVFHAASMAAVLVDAVTQSPVAVQCQQTAPDPWWKWLFEFALSVVPVAGGVWIALWSFSATSRKDHKQWILDNKKMEWQKLLILAAKIEYHMPSVAIGGRLVDAVKGSELEEHLRLFTQATLECVFATSVVGGGGIYDKLISLRQAKEQAVIDIMGYESSPSVGLDRPLETAQKFQAKLAAILRDVHILAKEDLNIS